MKDFFKRTTILSMLSAVLCMGAFFLAGFGLCCISASASVNTVRAGSMDIAFELSRDGRWCNAEGVTMAFCDASGVESDTLVWEPGCTYELPMLRICNNSELDVKYTVAISGINGDDKLNEVIDWYYVTDDGAVELSGISGTLSAGAVTEPFTIRGHMHENASNAYQGLTIDSICLTVAATQASNPSEPGAGETGVPYYAINTDTDLVIDERNSYIILDDEVQNILASVSGQKITVSNATLTGETVSVMLGEYRTSSYCEFNLEANNFNVLNLNVLNGVRNGSDLMSIATYAYGTTVLNDCVMMGTTSSAEGYQVYDLGFVNRSTGTINGGRYGAIYIWSQAHVTITDAEVDRIVCSAITTRNLGMLTIAEGTHVGTLELTTAGYQQYKPALTIEEGAVVDEIIYRGVRYTQEEWLASNPL